MKSFLSYRYYRIDSLPWHLSPLAQAGARPWLRMPAFTDVSATQHSLSIGCGADIVYSLYKVSELRVWRPVQLGAYEPAQGQARFEHRLAQELARNGAPQLRLADKGCAAEAEAGPRAQAG